MLVAEALVVQVGLTGVIATVATGRWKALAAAGALGCLATPVWVRTEQLTARFFLAFYAGLVAMRTLDLIRGRELPWWRRFWHLNSFFDTRLTTARPRALEGRCFAAGLAWLLGGGIALALVLWCGKSQSPLVTFPLRWLACGVAFVCALQAVSAVLKASYALVGVRTPPMQNRPWLARTVNEFWARRWNLAVSTWLRMHLQRPIGRGRSWWVGSGAAFAASAAIHFYLVLVCLGVGWAGLNALFFASQFLVVWGERALGVGQWRSAGARAWTWAALLITSPLFCEPLARIFEPLRAVPGVAKLLSGAG